MSKYKTTEFGEIPDEWDLKLLIDLKSSDKSSIAMGPFGSNIKAENFVTDGVPVIRGTNLNFDKYVSGEFVYLTEKKADELKGSNCKPGDLVFTHRGTIGQVCIIPENKYPRYVISQSGMKLTVDKSKINNEFLFYFFKSKAGQFQLLKNEAQVGVPSISNPLTTLKSLQVPVPNISEQNLITSILCSLDDKIELLHRQIRTIELLAETLFRQWFIEFEFTNIKGEHYKSMKGKMIDSKLGEIPEGWQVKPLKDCLKHLIDNRGKTPKYELTGVPALSAKFVKGGNIVNSNSLNFISKKLYDNSEKLEIGDIIMTSEAPLGELFFIAGNTIYYPAQRVFALRADKKILSPEYLFGWLNCRKGQFLIKSRGSGSTVEGIKQSELNQIEILIPSIDLIENITNFLKPIFIKKESNYTQIRSLTLLRDTLLPKLMSGEVRVNMNNN